VSNGRINDELEVMWKEEAVAQSIISAFALWGTKENHKKPQSVSSMYWLRIEQTIS
jgi:hypothetical protein